MKRTTAAERRVDAAIHMQRSKGRKKYGKGLNFRDAYDWNFEAIQELVDAVHYLACENLRLRRELKAIGAKTEAA